VAPRKLAAFASRARRRAGLLDLTPAFESNRLGPCCLHAATQRAVSTGSQPAFTDALRICAQTVR